MVFIYGEGETIPFSMAGIVPAVACRGSPASPPVCEAPALRLAELCLFSGEGGNRMTGRSDLFQPSRGKDAALLLLLGCGLFLLPMHLRAPLLEQPLGRYLCYLNFPCALAVLFSFVRRRRWEVADIVALLAWLALLIPLLLSNRQTTGRWTLTAIAQNLLPLFLCLYRMEERSKRHTLRLCLRVFDGFVLLLLLLAVVERLSGKAILVWLRDGLTSLGFSPKELTRYMEDNRFASVWGHPLTMALMFNAFFALNAVWFRSEGKKFPVLPFFALSLAGTLLCSSKTGVVLCLGQMVVVCWREQKKILLFAIPLLAGIYFAGGFNSLIERFTAYGLTTYRAEELEKYFATGVNPLHLFSGYGSGKVMGARSAVAAFNNAFEFPLMMYAYEYGIVFSIVHVLGLYAYVTWRFLRERRWLPWLLFSVLFAEINTYNAYALRNQDVCFLFAFFTLLLLNMPRQSFPVPETEAGCREAIQTEESIP